MNEFWIKLGEMFEYALNWLSINAPIIMEWIKNLVISGGITTIVFATLKYVVPLLRNNNKPILKKLKELEEEVKLLKDELDKQAQVQKQKDDVILGYISLSCKVNSDSITLEEEEKEKFLEIHNKIEIGFKSTLDDVGQTILVNNGNTTDGKISMVLDNVEDVLEIAPKVVETVQDLKKML